MNSDCLQTAVVGIGGYGAAHHDVLALLEQEGLVKVRATCDPRASELSSLVEKFRFAERGVRIAPGFADMFSDRLDLVSIAAPIHLHAMMHRACVEHGAACYLEKPPTLDPEELAAMIAVDQSAPRRTHVGFHLLHQAERLSLKQRMVNGEFGQLRRAVFLGSWRRAHSYFQRNTWAGRLILGDTILLDSCCANAMSHYVNSVLFFAGTSGLHDWAAPVRADAELYRANPIEGTDTVFVRAELDNGVQCWIAATHACESEHLHREIYHFDRATVEIPSKGPSTIRFQDGRTESLDIPDSSLRGNFRDYLRYLRGEVDRPSIRLEDCEPFVNLNAMLYLAVPRIADIPASHLRELAVPAINSSAVVIEGVQHAMDTFGETGRLPSEIGAPWAQPGGSCEVSAVPQLGQKLRELIAG